LWELAGGGQHPMRVTGRERSTKPSIWTPGITHPNTCSYDGQARGDPLSPACRSARAGPADVRRGPYRPVAMVAFDHVTERRRAAALARHYCDREALSIAEIVRRLGRAQATVKAYLYDQCHANKRPTDSWLASARAGCPAPPAGLGF
jgi:hypothetical protein